MIPTQSGLRQEAREPYPRRKNEKARWSQSHLLRCFPVEGVDFRAADDAVIMGELPDRSQLPPGVSDRSVINESLECAEAFVCGLD